MGQKDLTQKNLEHYPDVFADIINALLYQGKQVVEAEALQPAPTETIYRSQKGRLRSQLQDVSKYEVKAGTIRVQYTIENETNPDSRLVLRKAGYEGAVYREQYDRKSGTVYPFVSLVLYWGKGKRTIKGSIHALLGKGLPEEILPYIDDARLHIYNMRSLPEEVRRRFRSDMRIIADYLAQGEAYQPTSQPILHIEAFLLLMKELSGDSRYGQMLSQIEKSGNQGGGVTMCGLLDKYENRGIQKGMEKGIQKGIEKGIQKGMEKGIEKGLQAFIELCQEVGLTQKETVSKVMQKFSVSGEESQQCMQKYWHA